MRRDIICCLQQEALKRCRLPSNFLEWECIRNHRGSVKSARNTIEERCVADADAISHFDNVPELLYLAYVQRNMTTDEGKEFVRKKLDRSFAKLSDESKKFYMVERNLYGLRHYF